MARFLYSVLFYLLLPGLLIRLLLRARQSPGYARNWWQRLGFAPQQQRPSIWVHAVSVGETVAARPLIEELLTRYPAFSIVVTGMTATGAERVRSLFGDRVVHSYAPWDLPDAVARFIDRTRPAALLIMETELWPNWLHGCRGKGVPVCLINARMSERSAAGYSRVSALVNPMMQCLSWVSAQSEMDAGRLARLGVPPRVLSVTGSIKFDMKPDSDLLERAQRWRASWAGESLCWVAGSTHDGEERVLLDMHERLRQKIPGLKLILVPRHPERFDAVAEQLAGRSISYARRSRSDGLTPELSVLLGDTMGELMLFYAASDVAFVGGSLVERGGHNPLEPAMLGRPVVMGPHVFNFQEICDALESAGGLKRPSARELEGVLSWLLSEPEARAAMAARASKFVDSNRGALQRTLAGIQQIVDAQSGLARVD